MEAIACDVLVIGSGAAGLTTAITAQHFGADVLVVEKASTFGGTTARSGGWLWAPGNSLATRAGVDDPLDHAKTYIQHGAVLPPDRPRQARRDRGDARGPALHQ